MGRMTEAVKHIIILNVILFIAPQLMPDLNLQNLFALYFPENEKFGFWQFLNAYVYARRIRTYLV